MRDKNTMRLIFLTGSGVWIRTKIRRSRISCPTIRRPRKLNFQLPIFPCAGTGFISAGTGLKSTLLNYTLRYFLMAIKLLIVPRKIPVNICKVIITNILLLKKRKRLISETTSEILGEINIIAK